MKMYTKLFIAGAIFFALAIIIRSLMVFSTFCFIGGFILLIVQGVTEITNKNKTPSEKDYAEAWKAYEDITKKRKQDNTPPWEK